MEFLLLTLSVLFLSFSLSGLLLVAFVNLGVFPPPEEGDLASKLYWLRPPHYSRINLRTVGTMVVTLASFALVAVTVYWGFRLLLVSHEQAFFRLLLFAGVAQAALTLVFVQLRQPTRERGIDAPAAILSDLRASRSDPATLVRWLLVELVDLEHSQAGILLISLLRESHTRDIAVAAIREIEANTSLHGLFNPLRLQLDEEIRRLASEGPRPTDIAILFETVRHLLSSPETYKGWEKVHRRNAVQRRVKRCLDACLSSTMLVAFGTIPVIIIVALWLRIGSGSKLIFASRRQGRRGKEFTYYQFDVGFLSGRYPRLKGFLSDSGLDRLPALVNVLRGDMSFVGPAPLYRTTAVYLVENADVGIAKVLERLGVRPGLTGPSQLDFFLRPAQRDCEKYVQMDIEYVKSWSLMGDCIIMLRSVKVFLTRLLPRAIGTLLRRPRELREVVQSHLANSSNREVAHSN